MWGDLTLIKFYPKNWQASLARSGHTWILHTSLWHYWLLFTFIIAMNLFVIYIYKTLSYQRADIRGTKATGDKRRLAWPEMLTVLLPLYWAINIVTNALAFLRAVEGSCGNVVISVQLNGFQWGWKYCYSDTFYTKYLTSPVLVGYDSVCSLQGRTMLHNKTKKWITKVHNGYRYHFLIHYRFHDIKPTSLFRQYIYPIRVPEEAYKTAWEYTVNADKLYDLTSEHYFCRQWLKNLGKVESELNSKVLNKKFQHGYWIVSQGLNPDSLLVRETLNKKTNSISVAVVRDPLRLLRASGALVLPTRSNIRLMGCSDDVTHSWAVPSLGIKMDCVPGRLFFFYTNIIREGIYFGQCSELCGWNHYNMPIVLYALPIEHFIAWWEIELHSLYRKKLVNKGSVEEKHYKLINYKYK
jgi:heme/copper-type cytochrome/quinol oxidase subunit 2